MHKFHLNCRGKILDLTSRTHIMGIINCTPDSFYSASRNYESKSAIGLGIQMVREGADILDIGGESTRPGSESVSAEEELRRITPVIEGLLDEVDVPLSIDTYKSIVAERAFELGVHILNDISALNFDPELGGLAARFDVPVILMHIKGRPKEMQKNPTYFDVINEIYEYFENRIRYALDQGIKREMIILDPGIGFGKRVKDNYEIIKRLKEFTALGCPILVGPSRKSFIGKVLNLPSEETLEGTLAAGTAAILKGAHILRVHDVKEMIRSAKIADCLI
ncbi:MAG: dihydropteroate synthase [bacterium]